VTTDDHGSTARSTCAALMIQQASTLLTIPVSTHKTWSSTLASLVLDDRRTRQPPAGKARRTRSDGGHRYLLSRALTPSSPDEVSTR
jgi:hypothetical protein